MSYPPNMDARANTEISTQAIQRPNAAPIPTPVDFPEYLARPIPMTTICQIEKMFKAVKEGLKEDGKEKMKPFAEKLKDDEIKALVAHVRSLKK